MQIDLDLTTREAALLTTAACEYFHRIKELESHEIYGALVISENVLAARSMWNKIEAVTKINDW